MSIKKILENLANGVYDGVRTDSEMNGVYSGFYIKNGVPVKYREGKGSKYFDGRENVKLPGKRSEETFETDESKIVFFNKYGFIKGMFGNHPEVTSYSSEYYERKKK